MDTRQLIKFFKFLCKMAGIKKSGLYFGRWGVYAYPIYTDEANRRVVFKLYAYLGVDSSRERAMKAVCGHAVTCLTAGLGVGTSGLGAVGSAGTGIGKFGALNDAFGVDIGAVQLSSVLEGSSSRPTDLANAIINSGRMLHRAVICVEGNQDGSLTVYYRNATDPWVADFYSKSARKMHDGSMSIDEIFTVFPGGAVISNRGRAGNFMSRKVYNS